jgi:hypothetical protein
VGIKNATANGDHINSVLFTPQLTIETANSGNLCCELEHSERELVEEEWHPSDLEFPRSATQYWQLCPTRARRGTGIQVQAFQTAAPVTLVSGKVTVNAKRDSIRANLSLVDAQGNTLVSVDAI